MKEAAGTETDLIIEGQDRLLDKPEFHDSGDVRRLMTARDAREQLVKLIDLAMGAKGGHVVVGEEVGDIGGGQLAVVGAAYIAHGQASGTVAVIGPTRMDYPRVMPLVAATATAMSEFMERAESRKDSDEE
jgi:heat-inducible transcriptional repressor